MKKHQTHAGEGSRVIAIRVSPETLRDLRYVALMRDTSLCGLLRGEAEKLIKREREKVATAQMAEVLSLTE